MPRPGRQTTERAKDFKGTLLQLLKTLGAYKISLIVVIVFIGIKEVSYFCGSAVFVAVSVSAREEFLFIVGIIVVADHVLVFFLGDLQRTVYLFSRNIARNIRNACFLDNGDNFRLS